MNNMKYKVLKKTVLVFIIFTMLTSFIMPSYAFAADDDEEETVEDAESGGKLFTPITELVLAIADRLLATMQDIFVGENNWKDAITADSIKQTAKGEDWINRGTSTLLASLISETGVSRYSIKYSPGVIFSGKVPALDINFISPMKETTIVEPQYKYTEIKTGKWKDIKEEYHAPNDLSVQKGSDLERVFTGTYDRYFCFWNYNGDSYYFIYDEDTASIIKDVSTLGLAALADWIKGKIDGQNGTLYKYTQVGTNTYNKDSTAKTLQAQVSKWYMALRTFALVGLLSVLVYIGIRIILSSGSAQNQAKYKNMLKNWLVAICMLFILHYMMAFILTITSKICDVFIPSSITVGGEDIFASNIRNQIVGEDSLWTHFGYVVMYGVLVILTLTYTVQYVKRVVYIAFLTMIAPLIALTYPIDKVKDGQAQAFSMWLKEYIFNCLLQPVHLLIYVLFLDTASGIVDTNPIFAIIVLAFMTPAEKFFRKMFGLDKASSVSTLGAAAGGAMVMSMLNKIKSKPGKDAGEEKAPSVRTATKPAGTTATGTAPVTPTTPVAPAASVAPTTPVAPAASGTPTTPVVPAASGTPTAPGTQTAPVAPATTSTSTGMTYASTTGHRKIRGANKISSFAGKLTRKAGGVVFGGALGTAALMANIVDGDLFDNTGKALGEIGATSVLGFATGSNMVGKGMNAVTNANRWAKKMTLGVEEYNNRLYDKQFYESEGYKMIAQDDTIKGLYGNNVAAATQSFLNNGITDATKIREALQNNINADNYFAYSKADVSSVKDMEKLQTGGVDADTYKAFKESGISNAGKVVNLVDKLRKNGVTNKDEMARRASLASNLKKQGLTTEKAIKAYFRKKGLDKTEIDKIYNEIKDVLT